MSDLKPLPCPFCGGEPRCIERPDNIDGTRFFYALACSCGRHSACAHKMAVETTPEQARHVAIEAWNNRAQPAITSETGNQAAQGASAITSVPLLTDEEIDAAYEKARAGYQRSRFAVRGQQLTAQDSTDWWFARAVEQAVRSKLGAGVPMTEQEILDAAEAIKAKRIESARSAVLGRKGSKCSQCGGVIGVDSNGYNTFNRCESCNHVPMFNIDGVEYRHHGIVGKEGA